MKQLSQADRNPVRLIGLSDGRRALSDSRRKGVVYETCRLQD